MMDTQTMLALVQQIPSEMLQNYVTTYEQGRVKGYTNAGYCVASSLLNSPEEDNRTIREAAWYRMRSRMGSGTASEADRALRELERGYMQADLTEKRYPEQLYMLAVEVLAQRGSVLVAQPQEQSQALELTPA